MTHISHTLGLMCLINARNGSVEPFATHEGRYCDTEEAMADFQYSPPTEPWLDVVHRDRDTVVVNKPSGLLSVPGKVHFDSALRRLQAQEENSYAVHRIDMDTSGLLIFALRRKAERELHRQFRERLVRKVYVALVDGLVSTASGMVASPLRRVGGEPPSSVVDHHGGKSARTDFQVLGHYDGRTLLALRPFTGRSHQLRVHMLSLGHPIAGDRIYNPDCGTHNRLMLHAIQIHFLHPFSHEPVCLSCLPLEADFQRMIQDHGGPDAF